jgi:hypothetical protein
MDPTLEAVDRGLAEFRLVNPDRDLVRPASIEADP